MTGNKLSKPDALATPINSRSLPSLDIVFGCVNIRSLTNKADDVFKLRHDRQIDVICFTETWHDSDSVAFSRLRADGYRVADRPRPRQSIDDDLSTNHGGVAVVALVSVVTPVSIPSMTTFETMCVSVVVRGFKAIIVVIYRPGSQVIQSLFFLGAGHSIRRYCHLPMPVVCGR
jgi:exonuclease III